MADTSKGDLSLVAIGGFIPYYAKGIKRRITTLGCFKKNW
jgi:hypothetical protein